MTKFMHEPLVDVCVVKGFGIFGATTWLKELSMLNVLFEFDNKLVVDSFKSTSPFLFTTLE